MCTVILLRATSPGLPLVVAANRDEFYARPTSGPRRDPGGGIVSGVDEVSGGTWMGATAGGLIVAVTNQRTGRAPDPTRRSRGAVVTACLAAGSRAAARALVAALDPAAYNPFNLVIGDATGVDVAYVHGDGPAELVTAPTGVTVITNDRIGSPEFPRAEVAASLARAIAAEPWPRLAASLAGILAAPPTCLHSPHYGTRSATIAAVAPSGLAHYLVSLDAACRAPMVDVRRT